MQAIMPLQRRRTNMKATFKHSIIPAIALAFAISTPASAQLLGGSGGGGGLTGGLGGGLGGDMTGPITRTTGSVTGNSTGSLKGEKQVDRKSGRVRGSGQAQGSSNGSVTGGTTVLDRSVNGASNGSANASKSGSFDAQLIGTDAVRGTAQDGVGRARGAADTIRGTASSTGGTVRSAAANAVGSASGAGSIAGGATGMGNGVASGSLGQLAASGSAAANSAGMFAIEPGMPIEDAKGRTIGYVQSVKQTKQGVVQAVTVEIGDRLATLPAANFSGSGDALVTGMTKGKLTSAAKHQEAAPATGAQSESIAPSAPKSGGDRSREANNNKER
jgi:hypothetical protein